MKANPNFLYLKKNVPEKRVTLLQGGTRSGKTFSIIYWIIWLCREHPNAKMEIDICRDTFKHLKDTAWKDFKDVLIKHELYDKSCHNMTNGRYILYGNIINYYGADSYDSHGRSRDILWINEAHLFPVDTIDQLFPRTRYRIIADYNPALPVEHWLDEYIEDYPPLITTYKDNPHLTAEQIADIERREKNEYWWKVWGTGRRSQPTGAVFTNYSIGKFEEHEIIGFGQDYGFSKDATTLIKVSIDKPKRRIYLFECYHETKLSQSQILDLNRKYAGDHLIVGDSAEARLIRFMFNEGLNIVECVKGAGSITSGISLMLDYELIIDPKSINMIKEFNNYKWLDKTNKSLPEDKWNHCIDAARYFITKVLENPHHKKYYIS